MHWIKCKDEPVYGFLTGGVGVGKSVVIRALYQTLYRILNMKDEENPDDKRILLCAFMGFADFNLSGHTICSAFHKNMYQGTNHLSRSVSSGCFFHTSSYHSNSIARRDNPINVSLSRSGNSLASALGVCCGGGGGGYLKFFMTGCAGRTLKTPPIPIKAKPEKHTYSYNLT